MRPGGCANYLCYFDASDLEHINYNNYTDNFQIYGGVNTCYYPSVGYVRRPIRGAVKTIVLSAIVAVLSFSMSGSKTANLKEGNEGTQPFTGAITHHLRKKHKTINK